MFPEIPTAAPEDKFYQPLANWLNEQDISVTAITLGGAKFFDRYGTPDVIGKREFGEGAIVTDLEIIAVEVKVNPKEILPAFGQATAYQLFAHRVYLCIPRQCRDNVRILDLCEVHGIGIITFDPTKPKEPGFRVELRPRKGQPNLSYTNRYMHIITHILFD